MLSGTSTLVKATTTGQLNAADELLAPNANLVFGSGKSVGGVPVQSVKYNGTWPQETSMNPRRYVQFSVSPKTGSILNIDSVAMTIGAVSSNNLHAVIFYSTDSLFAYATQLGSAYVLSASALQRVSFSSLGIKVQSGQTFYVRIYPWDSASGESGKYLAMLNVVIGGSTESVPVSSSVIWPCVSDLSSSVVSGTMKADTVSLSHLLNYGALSYNGVQGQSVYTGAIWQAEAAPAEGRYIQFAASPKSGGQLVADSVSVTLAAYATNNLRVSVYYSNDSTFTLANGIKLGNDIALTNGVFHKTTFAFNIKDTVNSGSALYLRLYPYSISTSGDQWKLVGLDSISVFGRVTGITADPPTIATSPVTNISTTFVTSGGTISSDGGAAVTERGLVYSNTSVTPTINDNKLVSGSGSGTFVAQLSGLLPGTTYYVRAYAINSAGTSYGSVITFTTMSQLTVPVVTTNAVTAILAKTATGGGNVTDWGGSPVTSRGICWSQTANPTINDSISTNGIGTGAFTSSLFQLIPSATYHVRAFAINSTGVGYGNDVTFTTQPVAPDVIKTVGKDINADYNTIQAAFNDVPDNYTGRWIIYVKPGTYYEKCELAATKPNVYLIGLDPDSCIITYNAYAGQSNGAGGTLGTNNSFSVAIDANDFYAANITFQNTQKNDGSTGTGAEQAVALRTKGDRQQYYNCKLLGYQDTYYTNSNGRIYMKNCYIEGSVDFIFGNGVMVLDSCTTFVNRNGGVNCAPNTDAASKFGYVFMNCTLSSLPQGVPDFNGTVMSSFYLGRPWQNTPQAVYIHCYEPNTLNPQGWLNMTDGLNPFFAEYQCNGPGSNISNRSTNVNYYGHQLTDDQAANYTVSNIFAKTTNPSFAYNWMPSSFSLSSVATRVETIEALSGLITMDPIFPNPLVQVGNIHYLLAKNAFVKVALYNSAGVKVKTLLEAFQMQGSYHLAFQRQSLPSGIYFITLQADQTKISKSVLIQ
ncbi:MAG: pectinesterase family protein [Microbacter sp.]